LFRRSKDYLVARRVDSNFPCDWITRFTVAVGPKGTRSLGLGGVS